MSADQGMLDAIGYIRVSTGDQADHGVSLDAQRESLTHYALLHKLNLVEIVVENAISGSVPLADRPGGRRLLELIGKKQARQIVAIKLDRLFRDAADALAQTGIWDRAGVTLHLIDVGGQAINTSSAMGRMFLTMMAGFAELERNLIAERTAAALAHKKAKRQAYAPTPLGFRRDGDQLIPDADEQATVRRILDLRGTGMSYDRIAKQLNTDGVTGKAGGKFYASTISKIVGNDLHA